MLEENTKGVTRQSLDKEIVGCMSKNTAIRTEGDIHQKE